MNKAGSTKLDLRLSEHEMNAILEKKVKAQCHYHPFIVNYQGFTRLEITLAYRLNLNSLRTKFNNTIKCVCNESITVKHLLCCQRMRPYFPVSFSKLKRKHTDFTLYLHFARHLLHSPVGRFL